MNWYRSESLTMPSETDTTSSGVYNYVRRDITEVEREQEDGTTITVYEYEECMIPKESWGMYLDLSQAQADIDYLNMITEDL